MVNKWTRDDLPEVPALRQADDERGTGNRSTAFDIALDVVVDHLNRAHPKPEQQSSDSTYGIPREDYAYVDWPATCAAANERADRAEADRDRWRRAHEIVEGERDQARRERDEAAFRLAGVRDAHTKWKARAEAAARELNKWQALPWGVALDENKIPHFLPVVTREDVKGVIDHWIEQGGNHEALLDDLWRWVSGSDPAVHVVRESHIAAVEVTEAGQFWRAGDTSVPLPWKANKVREKRDECAAEWAEMEAIVRAIEAGQAVDPVEELAGQIEAATRAAIRQVCVDLADVVPSLDSLTVERAMEVTAASRKVAAQVLGQEAGDA